MTHNMGILLSFKVSSLNMSELSAQLLLITYQW